VFNISSGVTVTIKDLTIKDGDVTDAPGEGGGIYNDGDLTLERIAVTNCDAQGTMDTTGEDGKGGGICNNSTLTMSECVIYENGAQGGSATGTGGQGGSGHGGGLYNSNGSPATITNCTFSGNRAEGGGALDVNKSGSAYGGGIYSSDGSSSDLTLIHCTISGNSVSSWDSDKIGGGVYTNGTAGNGPEINACIFANNTGPSDSDGPDLKGFFISNDYNLIENTNGYMLIGTITNNIEGSDPLLDALADNGGPTMTHALQTGSPAIDVITSGSCSVSKDQRGYVRPAGSGCDIGAYEFESEGTTFVYLYDQPLLDGWTRFPMADDTFIDNPGGSFYIGPHMTSGNSIGGSGRTSDNAYSMWESPGTDIPYIANQVYRIKYTIRTTQTDQSLVPNLRLLTEVIGSGIMAVSGGGRLGVGPFAPTTTPEVYNMYLHPPDLSSASPSVTNLRIKFEVIDFSENEEGTNYLDQVEVQRFTPYDVTAGTFEASWTSPADFSSWSPLTLGSPFGPATVSSSPTGLYIETPVDVTHPIPNYGQWSLTSGSSGVQYEVDKLYRVIYTMSSMDQSTLGKIRIMSSNEAVYWVSKLHLVPDQTQVHMPDADGEEYSIWQETLPVLYGDNKDRMTLLFDVADGSDSQHGRVYLTGVEIYSFSIP
jgi:hypothetical protein